MTCQPDRIGLRASLPTLCVAAGLAVCAVATSCFWVSEAPFVVGEGTLLREPLLSHWGNVPTIFSGHFTAFTDGEYRPFSCALLAAVRTFVPAGNATFWHLWLAGFHWLNALLVYLLARQVLAHAWGAGVAAGFFVLHPLGTLVVNHIDNFHYALGMTLLLNSATCYVAASRNGRPWWWLSAIGLFALALLTTMAALVLPVVLVTYEITRRASWRGTTARLTPFVGLLALMAPIWRMQAPPPVYYRAPAVRPGTWQRNLISVAGGSGQYVKGLLVGTNISTPLAELVPRRRSPGIASSWPVAPWTLLMAGTVWLVWRARRGTRGSAGLALVWIVATFGPFGSVTWLARNGHVSWPYVYLPLAGLSLLVGTFANEALRLRLARRRLVVGLLAAWCCWLGLQLVRRNLDAGSDLRYWHHVLALNPQSECASIELGKAHLRRGDVAQAIPMLFSPSVVDISASCRSMMAYYLNQGEPLAAAVHCQHVKEADSGLKFQTRHDLHARLLRAAGALGLAQEQWQLVLLANPYRTDAMGQLAEIWRLKGFATAARHLVARARAIDPNDSALGQMAQRLDSGSRLTPVVAVAPSDQLHYFTTLRKDPVVLREIVVLAERHSSDPVILMAAGCGLVRLGEPARACAKLDVALRELPSSSLLWATKCYALVQIGAYAEASQAADEALRLGSLDAATCCIVGTALLQQRRTKRAIQCLRRAIELDPSYADGHRNLASALLASNKLHDAIGHLRTVVHLAPEDPQSHMDLARALTLHRELDEAIRCLHTALQLNPNLIEAHTELAEALKQRGDTEEAARHRQAAERLRSDAGAHR